MNFETARYALLFLLTLPIMVTGVLLFGRLLDEALDIKRRRAAELKEKREMELRYRKFEEDYAKRRAGGELRY